MNRRRRSNQLLTLALVALSSGCIVGQDPPNDSGSPIGDGTWSPSDTMLWPDVGAPDRTLPPDIGRPCKPMIIEAEDPLLVQSSGWVKFKYNGMRNGQGMASSEAARNELLGLKFWGRGVIAYLNNCLLCGSISVALDGKTVHTVDTNALTSKTHVSFTVAKGLPLGEHEVRLTDISIIGWFVEVDYFAVTCN